VVNQHRSVEVLEALLKESERKNEEQVRRRRRRHHHHHHHHQDTFKVSQCHSATHTHTLSLSLSRIRRAQARFIQYLQAELERLSSNNNNGTSGSAADHPPAGDRGQSQEQAAVMRGGGKGKGKEKLQHDERDGLPYVDADKENRVPTTTTPVVGPPPPPASCDSAHHQAEEESARKEEHDERVAQFTPLTRRPVVHGNVNHRDRQEMLHYVCPLTRGIFKDPVFCADGHTYERQAIKLYLKGHHRSPLTGMLCRVRCVCRVSCACACACASCVVCVACASCVVCRVVPTNTQRALAGQRLDSKKLTPNYHLRKLLAAKRDFDPVFSTVNFFAVLPYELLCVIFSQLDAVSLGRAMMVRSFSQRQICLAICLTRTHHRTRTRTRHDCAGMSHVRGSAPRRCVLATDVGA
jgi:hypothetical protein